jgi:hypothetical protein
MVVYFLKLNGASRKKSEHQCRGLNRKVVLDILFTSRGKYRGAASTLSAGNTSGDRIKLELWDNNNDQQRYGLRSPPMLDLRL